MVVPFALTRLRLKSSWPEDNLVSNCTEEAVGSLKSDIFVSNSIYRTLIHSWTVSRQSLRVVQKAVNTYWVDILKPRASLYSSLECLCVDSYWPGKKHPLIQNVGCVSDAPRVHTKLKLVTGVYVLQVNRACFNQNNIDATCQHCHQADETVAHFLLDCPVLESVKRPVLETICNIEYKLVQCHAERDHTLQLILDSSCFTGATGATINHTSYRYLEMQTRRQCHIHHIERY